MKFHGAFTAFTAFVGLVHALPATTPAELTTEDLLQLAQGISVPDSGIEKRAAYKSDVVYRLLVDKRHRVAASAFCSQFIRSTVTVTKKVELTIKAETTETPPPVTVTEVNTLTETETSTSTSYIPTTVVPIPALVKRDNKPKYPTWLCTTYSPARVSSACSCLITRAPIVRTTKTIVTGTVTTFTNTVTLPPVSVTESSTTVTTATSIVPTSKVINCGVTPACRKGSSPFLGDPITGTTREQCLTQCLNLNGCRSIQWGQSGVVSGACFLGTDTVENTFAPGISGSSSICQLWIMDDVECLYV